MKLFYKIWYSSDVWMVSDCVPEWLAVDVRKMVSSEIADEAFYVMLLVCNRFKFSNSLESSSKTLT